MSALVSAPDQSGSGPFHVITHPLPPSLSGLADNLVARITLCEESAIIWIGIPSEGAVQMGPLSASFPRQFDGDLLPSVATLVGYEDESDNTTNMIAARIAKRVGWPIFVSFSASFGDDEGIRIALARLEKDVSDFLLEFKNR